MPNSYQGSLWGRFKSRFRWENLIVSGKEVKGFVVSPGIAVVLLGALLSVVGWAYTSNTKDSRETHDAVIRMETMLNERTQRFKDEQAEFKAKLEDERTLAKLQRDNQDKQLVKMLIALKAKGINIE